MTGRAASLFLSPLLRLSPINGSSGARGTGGKSRVTRGDLGPCHDDPPSAWANLNELNQIVNGLLAEGRTATAAHYLERASPVGAPTWEVGRPDPPRCGFTWASHTRQRTIWGAVASPPRPAVREVRVAVTYLHRGGVRRRP